MESRFRILFVDDEPRILDSLRRLLRRHQDQWSMTFACGAAEALASLATEPFDVVVSDLRMPGMDGLELLEQIRAQHPAMVRVLLSGQGPSVTFDDALLVAHQYLAKPCDPALLRTAIERTAGVRAVADDPELQALVGRCEHVVMVPRTYAQLTRLLDSEHAGTDQYVEVIERDPGLAARMLQLAGSAFFGVPRPVTTIAAAVTYLGTEIVRGLALAVHVFTRARTSVPRARLEQLERRALMTATLARRIAAPAQADSAFIAGMLTVIGELVILDATPPPTSALDPARVGAYLLGTWGLPLELVEAVGFHRRPSEVQHDGNGLVLAVHVADALARTVATDPPVVDRAFLERVGRVADLPRWQDLGARLEREVR